NQVSGIVIEPVGDVANLFQAVSFVIHRHDEIQGCANLFKQIKDSHLVKIIEEDVGRGRAAIHDDQICFVQHGENRINVRRVGDVEKPSFWMETLQRRVFVVGINGDVGDAVVFEELDKIDGEETFADAALAVDDGIELFLHNFWLKVF